MAHFLEFKNISKAFTGVQALSDVSFAVEAGEVHALMGENGAGKSTLMKILSGAYARDTGEILIDGKPVIIRNPKDAEKLGIAIIYQELNLIPGITAAENIFLARQPRRLGMFVDWKKLRTDAQAILDEIDANFDAGEKVSRLSVAQQQIVEIAKAVSLRSRILVMDEPTSALTERETEGLFKIIANLRAKGLAIVYISHRMEEIARISDKVTVMRDGTYIGTRPTADLTRAEIIEMMVGRPLSQQFPANTAAPGEVALRVEDLHDDTVVNGVSFEVRRGEVFGLAGLVGSGRTEIIKLIFGANKRTGGRIFVDGAERAIHSPKDAIRAGIGLIPEDRKREGLLLSLNVSENVVMAKRSTAMRHGLVSPALTRMTARRYIKELLIKTPHERQKVKFLSGGNQQKVVLAKWLNCAPEIIIMDEPTRGIDVNAKMEIYKIIMALAEAGKAVIVISSEMQEVMGLADRIGVVYEGRITGILSKEEATQEKIMHLASGGGVEQ